MGAECDRLAIALFWRVESYEDKRAVRTHKGLPDRRYVRPVKGQRIWVELKAPGGKLTVEQHAFLNSELDAGAMAVVIDDPNQLKYYLNALQRVSSIVESAVREKMMQDVQLCALRGFRKS